MFKNLDSYPRDPRPRRRLHYSLCRHGVRVPECDWSRCPDCYDEMTAIEADMNQPAEGIRNPVNFPTR